MRMLFVARLSWQRRDRHGYNLCPDAGSSSLKFQIFEIEAGTSLRRSLKGQIDGIGTRPRLRATAADGVLAIDSTPSPKLVCDLPAAIQETTAWLRSTQNFELKAVGHRVVHGGPEYSGAVLIDTEVVARLERYIPLAPLHQPNNLAPIRSLLARRPVLPQVACFDTAFHRGHTAVADHFAIPERFYAEGVRRYGFHGLSYEYVVHRLREVAPTVADKPHHRRSPWKWSFNVCTLWREEYREHDGFHRT